MSTIKNDLINELRNEIYYLEKDLVRLFDNSGDLSYKNRIADIQYAFSEITRINSIISTINGYLPEQAPAVPNTPKSEPVKETEEQAPEENNNEVNDVVSA